MRFELAPHGANLVLLDPGGTVAATLRLPKGAKERLTPGCVWSERALPSSRLDPFRETPSVIDAALSEGAAMGETPAATLTRRFVGLGSDGIEAARGEHLETGRSLGSVLRDRLDSILDGSSEVLIEGHDDPEGDRLLAWRPPAVRPGTRLFARGGPAATATAFYEARDAANRLLATIEALGGILRGELHRVARSPPKGSRGEGRASPTPTVISAWPRPSSRV